MMGRWHQAALALSAFSLLFSSTASAATEVKECVTQEEVANITLAIFPEAVQAVANACTKTLPPTALILQKNSAFLEKYRAESERAWPLAKSGLAKIGGLGGPAMLDSSLMRPLLTKLLSAKIEDSVKAKDCPAIDRILTLLEPLPARNAADLVATIAELSTRSNAAKGKPSGIQICPAAMP